MVKQVKDPDRKTNGARAMAVRLRKADGAAGIDGVVNHWGQARRCHQSGPLAAICNRSRHNGGCGENQGQNDRHRPMTPVSWELFDQLKQRLAAGDAEGVLEPLRALRQEWAEPDLATVRAEALVLLGRHDEALAFLQADLEAGTANYWTRYHLANQEKFAEAADAYRLCHALQGWTASEKRGSTFSHDHFSGWR